MKTFNVGLSAKSVAVGAVVTLAALSSQGALQVPYTPNADTLHLWHFDGPLLNPDNTTNIFTPDEVTAGGITLTNFGLPVNTGVPISTAAYTNIFLGNPSAAGLSNALRIVPPPSGGAFAFAGGGTNANTVNAFMNPESGAFTFEAIIRMEVNPFTSAGQWEIIAGDNQSLDGGRGWQFRINTPGRLEMNFITGGGGQWFGNLPSTGPDAAAAGQWYHVAQTYTGFSPTNGDPAGVITFYWTLLDPNRTHATLLTNFNQTTIASLGGNPLIAIGGSGRTQTGVGNGEGFKGYIDEVRITAACLRSNEMAFTTGDAEIPPTFTSDTSVNPPATVIVPYGETLTLQSLAVGSLPITYQWQRDGGDVGDQINNTLVISNVTFAAAGGYRAIAENAFGRATSSVAQVTVGAAVSELFNTGVDDEGTLLNAEGIGGAVDTHYRLIQSANPNNYGPTAIVWGNGAPTSEGGGLFVANGPDSVWIGPEVNAGQDVGTYIYETSFVVDSADPETVVLNGIWWLSTAGLDILLNGQSTGIQNFIGTPEKFGDSFTITDGFVSGLNTLTFVITNGIVNFAGFRAELSAIGEALPPGLPEIIEHPDNETVRDANMSGSGASASFEVVALGRPPLSYQWLSGGVPIPDATNRTLTFLSPAAGGQGSSFRAVVSNDSGSVTSQVATLTIVSTNQLLKPPTISVSTSLDTPLVIPISRLVNEAIDPDHDPITFLFASSASTNGGIVSQEGANLVYTPVAGFLGADQFDYYLSDPLESVQGFVNITVAVASSPQFSATQLSGHNVVFSGSGGAPGGGYTVLSATDLTEPPGNWTTVTTGTFDTEGEFSVNQTVNPGEPQRYFILQVP